MVDTYPDRNFQNEVIGLVWLDTKRTHFPRNFEKARYKTGQIFRIQPLALEAEMGTKKFAKSPRQGRAGAFILGQTAR